MFSGGLSSSFPVPEKALSPRPVRVAVVQRRSEGVSARGSQRKGLREKVSLSGSQKQIPKEKVSGKGFQSERISMKHSQ